jgi:hypothetical protein
MPERFGKEDAEPLRRRHTYVDEALRRLPEIVSIRRCAELPISAAPEAVKNVVQP